MIAIIDFHGQYVHVIRNRLVELGVEAINVKNFEELEKIPNLKS